MTAGAAARLFVRRPRPTTIPPPATAPRPTAPRRPCRHQHFPHAGPSTLARAVFVTITVAFSTLHVRFRACGAVRFRRRVREGTEICRYRRTTPSFFAATTGEDFSFFPYSCALSSSSSLVSPCVPLSSSGSSEAIFLSVHTKRKKRRKRKPRRTGGRLKQRHATGEENFKVVETRREYCTRNEPRSWRKTQDLLCREGREPRGLGESSGNQWEYRGRFFRLIYPLFVTKIRERFSVDSRVLATTFHARRWNERFWTREKPFVPSVNWNSLIAI